MPPKSSAGKEKDIGGEEEVLQAVILADSFNKRFRPLTVGKPRCLLPVCNATLLDWTFESLALAGVQEIFVICRSFPEQVKAAIQESKWSKSASGIKIVPIITSKQTFTPGDAMRDIYTHSFITSDFVLVMGDLVSNVRIDEVVRIHKERRKTNKDAIMTMVVKESGAAHRTRSKGDSSVFVLDAQTSECLHYEPVIGVPPTKRVRIPRAKLAEHPEVEIRNDLIDCMIDVCSVDVPSLFQDNFDYGDIRRDFVTGVLTSDLLMKNIYCYVAKDGYAARVADTRSYDSVSKDILARWTFPLVPDDNHPGGHSYEHLRGNKYIAKDNTVSLSRYDIVFLLYLRSSLPLSPSGTCKINANTLIGSHTTVAPGAIITTSVIGQRCTIGTNVVLWNAYIFDDTTIGAGSVVSQCIVGSGVQVGEGSTIERGSLVGDGVVLGKNARLGPFERVSRRKKDMERGATEGDEDEDSEDEWEEIEKHQENAPGILGEGSNAIVWPQGPSGDDEDADEVDRFDNQRLMRIGDTASDLGVSDDEADDLSSSSDSASSSDTSSFPAHSRSSSRSSFSSSAHLHSSTNTIHTLSDAAAESEFRAEVKQSLERAFAEDHSIDNAAVELKTLRMASNVDLKRVREAVVAAIVEKVQIDADGDAAAQRREIVSVVKRWGALIDRIGGVDPVETVEVLQYHCARSARLPLFGQILATLYQADIVEEDDIRLWHTKPVAKGEGLKPGPLLDGVKHCWAVGGKMIEQFDEQESSDEDSEDGEEESEDE
ncbi:nucleotide-diphospho-sugar transferase [Cytidiella melzeri]|nr:nucleotide-diphospho-sugar transferase [Cytidiella melzeri]